MIEYRTGKNSIEIDIYKYIFMCEACDILKTNERIWIQFVDVRSKRVRNCIAHLLCTAISNEFGLNIIHIEAEKLSMHSMCISSIIIHSNEIPLHCSHRRSEKKIERHIHK